MRALLRKILRDNKNKNIYLLGESKERYLSIHIAALTYWHNHLDDLDTLHEMMKQELGVSLKGALRGIANRKVNSKFDEAMNFIMTNFRKLELDEEERRDRLFTICEGELTIEIDKFVPRIYIEPVILVKATDFAESDLGHANIGQPPSLYLPKSLQKRILSWLRLRLGSLVKKESWI